MSETIKRRSNFQKILHRFFSRKIAVLGLAIVIAMMVFALIGSALTPYTFDETNTRDRYQAPTAKHMFGTDELGRDLFARVVDGAGITLVVAFGSSVIALAAGTVLGLFSGYIGGRFDEILSGFMNSLWALPTIILAMAINVALGTSLFNILLSVGIVNIPGFYRIVRSRVISIKNMDYIMAARSVGQKSGAIVFSHVLPNLLSTLIVETSLCCSKAVIAEASLSFLGLGVQLPHASWGTLLKAGYPLMQRAPWLCVIPGLFIMTLVLGLNFLGDGIRDAFDVHINAD